ncbi:hypothetical protein [Chelatococcus reniformis]|uniref:Uncharacterized protein n=1 Tax=Chelatococcus reniformis TaxID=1494448 RepID=A0A916UTH5_9HYPH|nr:hypothetical protein [Chelatococcus reniformis]GGC87699.1 hypothetical protein GCM10010994_52100 [Chelatococcus reniformis]
MAGYLLQLAAWMAVMAVLILWPAGKLAYPGGWVLIGLFGTGGLAMILWLAAYSPSLLRERMAAPFQRDQKPWDRAWLAFFIVGFGGWMAFMAGMRGARTLRRCRHGSRSSGASSS